MTIQHVDIPDAERHELKGASTASSKQVPISNGDGTTSFGFINFDNIVGTPSFSVNYVEELVAFSTVDQNTGGVGVPTKITFGSGVTEDNVEVDSSGVIKFNTPSTYTMKFTLAAGRQAGGAASNNLFFRLVRNNTGLAVLDQIGQVFPIQLIASQTVCMVDLEYTVSALADDEFYLEMVKDTNNTVGVYVEAIPAGALAATPPWADAYSARVQVSRIGA